MLSRLRSRARGDSLHPDTPSPHTRSADVPSPGRRSPGGPSPGTPSPAGTATGTDRAPWRALRHTGMRWWSLANLLSNAGTWMQLTVQNLLVLRITGSAAATGASLAVQAAPGLLLGVAGGAAVDAWPRKLVATLSQTVLAAVAFTTAALVALGALNMALLLALAAVTGLIATVDGPACALFGNDLVPREDVPSAISLGSVVHSVGRLGGTALAGVTVGVFGTAAAYTANGLSFVFVAAVIPFLRPVRHAQPPAPERTGGAPGSSLAGLRFFLGRRRLVALAAITAISAVLGRNYALTLAALVTGPLGAGPGSYGAVSTVLAVGGTAGAVLAGRLRDPSVRLVAWLAAGGALLQAVAGLSPTVFLLAIVVIPMAIVETVSDTAATTVLQTDPPRALRGRVLGVWRSLSTAWGLAGPPLLGLFVQLAGARAALVLGGLTIAGATAAGALWHRRRTAASGPGPLPVPARPVGPVAAPASVG